MNFPLELINHIIHLIPNKLLPFLIGPMIFLEPHLLFVELVSFLLFQASDFLFQDLFLELGALFDQFHYGLHF